jgi:hypothetical protein
MLHLVLLALLDLLEVRGVQDHLDKMVVAGFIFRGHHHLSG